MIVTLVHTGGNNPAGLIFLAGSKEFTYGALISKHTGTGELVKGNGGTRQRNGMEALGKSM